MFAYYIAILKRLKSDRKGVTAMEYGVLAAATVVAVSAIIATVGTKLLALFTKISVALT
jgi:Flp pilus assembly pilin Flp